jgi:hypothetical protein
MACTLLLVVKLSNSPVWVRGPSDPFQHLGATAGFGQSVIERNSNPATASRSVLPENHYTEGFCPVSNMHNTILISTAIAAALPVIPIGHFLLFGWPARKQQIVSRLSDQSIIHYKETFCPKCDFTDNAGFASEYDVRYGRRRFWFPVISFCVTMFFLTYLCISWTLAHDRASASEGTAKIAILSLAGAYVWITYDLILRARQNDLGPSDINRATLRLLISLPFGFAISAFAGVLSGSAVTLSTEHWLFSSAPFRPTPC